MEYLRSRVENLRHRFLGEGVSDALRRSDDRGKPLSRGRDSGTRAVGEDVQRRGNVQGGSEAADPNARSHVVLDPGVADALDWWARARLHEETATEEEDNGTNDYTVMVNENGVPIRKYRYRRQRYNDIRRRYTENP